MYPIFLFFSRDLLPLSFVSCPPERIPRLFIGLVPPRALFELCSDQNSGLRGALRPVGGDSGPAAGRESAQGLEDPRDGAQDVPQAQGFSA